MEQPTMTELITLWFVISTWWMVLRMYFKSD